MKKIKLDNVSFIVDEDFTNSFSVSGYTFYPQNIKKKQRPEIKITTSQQIILDNRRHKQNAYVEYSGKQINSILYRNGRIGKDRLNSRNRKFLEDLLIIGTLLTA